MNLKRYYSPLRYPGGKGAMSSFFEETIKINNLTGCTYFEVYAGGAGIGLNLLFSSIVKKIILNDADYHIYAFWQSILYDTENFLKKLQNCTLSINTWKKHKKVYENLHDYSITEIGFSTFFLNRCNRSGILTKAGPIGGLNQVGKYLLDARFNKKELKRRITQIALRSQDIEIHHMDAIAFLNLFQSDFASNPSFIYLDPPYYKKGKSLYLNHYKHVDHVNIESALNNYRYYNWITTYDNAVEIEKIYATYRKTHFNLNYSLQENKKGREIMILSDCITIPNSFSTNTYTNHLTVRI